MMLVDSVNKQKNYKTERGARSKALIRIKSPKVVVPRRGESSQPWKKKKMVSKLMQLKVEMKEISKEQSSIKEGQRQVKQKYEAIESECRNLRQETMIMMQQSACTGIRLALMFQILKARESSDFAKAAELTLALRKVIAQQNQNHEDLEPRDDATSYK